MQFLRGFAANLAASALLVGCGDEAASGNEKPAQTGDLRIVSFSPAISRTLIDFHLDDKIVGRTPHCSAVNQSIPVVGDLLSFNYEQLIQLNPTHILVQPPATGIDPHLSELAAQRGWKLGQWRLNGIDDIETLVRELPMTLSAEGSTSRDQMTHQAATILNDIAAAISPGGGQVFRGRTMIVYSVDPVEVFGTGTYLNDILMAVGGRNAVDAPGWPKLALEDVVRLNPEAIIVVRDGSMIEAAPAALAGPLANCDVAAVRFNRLAVLNHPDALTPSTGVIGVAKELRTILESLHHRPQ